MKNGGKEVNPINLDLILLSYLLHLQFYKTILKYRPSNATDSYLYLNNLKIPHRSKRKEVIKEKFNLSITKKAQKYMKTLSLTNWNKRWIMSILIKVLILAWSELKEDLGSYVLRVDLLNLQMKMKIFKQIHNIRH